MWEKSPRTRIFWVWANSFVRFEQSYRAIANAVKLPGVEDPRTEILGLVLKWLESDSNWDWLMILDSADDASIFFSYQAARIAQKSDQTHNAAPLSTYLPQNPRGLILISSRDRNAAFQLTGRKANIIEVGELKIEEAKTLLRKKLPNDLSGEKDRTSLVLNLGYLPLAIT